MFHQAANVHRVVFPRVRVAIEVIDSDLPVKLPLPDAGGEGQGIAIQCIHCVEESPHLLGQSIPPVPVNVHALPEALSLIEPVRPLAGQVGGAGKQDVADVDRPRGDLRMVDHAKPGGAVLYIAVNFCMETIAVPEPMPFRVSPGRQHRLGGLGRRRPESEPGNLQFVGSLAAVVDPVAVADLDDGQGIVVGVEYNDVWPETQTGRCLAEPLGLNPSRPGWDCPQVGMVVAGKGHVGHFPGGLSGYVGPQEFEQFVFELFVGRGYRTFTAPTEPPTTLTPNTTYWASINEGLSAGAGSIISNTASDAERGPAGWTIGDGVKGRTTEDTAWNDATFSIVLAIRGSIPVGVRIVR